MYHLPAAHRRPHARSNLFTRVLLRMSHGLVWYVVLHIHLGLTCSSTDALIIHTGQSRRCPLCSQDIGDHLIHRIRSTYDYQKYFLPPLRTSPRPLARSDGARIAAIHRRRERAWGPRDRAAQDEADALERAVSRRRWLYQHDLYAKVRIPVGATYMRSTECKFPARRVKQIYALSPVPNPSTVCGVAGPHQSNDRLSAARATRLAEC